MGDMEGMGKNFGRMLEIGEDEVEARYWQWCAVGQIPRGGKCVKVRGRGDSGEAIFRGKFGEVV